MTVIAASARSTDSRTLAVAGACGLIAQIGFVALWVLWGFIEHGYDQSKQDVSDFGALDASHPIPYNVILSITGVLCLALAYGLYKALAPGIGAWLGSALIAVFGAGDFLDGLLREDCCPSGNYACRQALDAGQLSWHHTAHDIESLFTILSLIVGPGVLGFVFRRRARWRSLSWYSFATAAGVLGCAIVYAMIQYEDGAGIAERLAIMIATGWLSVISLRLMQESRSR